MKRIYLILFDDKTWMKRRYGFYLEFFLVSDTFLVILIVLFLFFFNSKLLVSKSNRK